MKSIVIANWKMNPVTFREAKLLFEATKRAAEKSSNVQVVVAPPALYVRSLALGYRGKIAFCIQNGFAETHGAHTGEISFVQAGDVGATYALVGHAERRATGESNEDTKTKVAGCLKAGLTPILCVGEKMRSSGGEHFAYIREQLRAALVDVSPVSLKKIIIAYEPVWAIGAKSAMQPREMHEMAIFIRKAIVEFAGEAGMECKMLYGGSVDEISAPEMLKYGDVRGLLVGRASCDPAQITNLLKTIQAV
jgi:triosephosphate isomerase